MQGFGKKMTDDPLCQFLNHQKATRQGALQIHNELSPPLSLCDPASWKQRHAGGRNNPRIEASLLVSKKTIANNDSHPLPKHFFKCFSSMGCKCRIVFDSHDVVGSA